MGFRDGGGSGFVQVRVQDSEVWECRFRAGGQGIRVPIPMATRLPTIGTGTQNFERRTAFCFVAQAWPC